MLLGVLPVVFPLVFIFQSACYKDESGVFRHQIDINYVIFDTPLPLEIIDLLNQNLDVLFPGFSKGVKRL